MKYLTPILDRSVIDIEYRTDKAFFNIEDWARIDNNTSFVRILMTDYYFSISISNNVITLPSRTHIPTAEELNDLIENIEFIRAASNLNLDPVPYNWENGEDKNSPTYTDANSWEELIELVRIGVLRNVSYSVSCGVPTVGQARFYQHRWRGYMFVPPSETPVAHARSGISSSGASLRRQNNFRRYA